MVSVVVPVYNVNAYLEEAIESLVNQSYKNLEIILVDDGSTDGSGELCDVYEKKDFRIKVIHQTNKGLSAARNTGLDNCKGEFVAFLDSDDAYCRNYVKTMLETLQIYDADIVECNYAIFKNIHRMNEKRISLKQKAINSHLKRAGIYTTREALNMQCSGKITNNVWNKLYKKEIWNNLRFSEGMNFEDLDIVLPLLEKAKKVCVLDECLVLHRQRKGSITQSFSFTNLRDRGIASQHYYEYIVEHTPLYFDREVQTEYLEKLMSDLLAKYFRYATLRITEKEKCVDFLRKQIDDVNYIIDIDGCNSVTVRVAYYFYCCMPLLLSIIVFKFYRLARRIIKIIYR